MKKRTLYILLALSIVGLFILGGKYLWDWYKKKKSNSVKPQDVQSVMAALHGMQTLQQHAQTQATVEKLKIPPVLVHKLIADFIDYFRNKKPPDNPRSFKDMLVGFVKGKAGDIAFSECEAVVGGQDGGILCNMVKKGVEGMAERKAETLWGIGEKLAKGDIEGAAKEYVAGVIDTVVEQFGGGSFAVGIGEKIIDSIW